MVAYARGGELNPAKWNSSAFITIGAAGASAGASAVATNLTNNYLDNYNKPPVLGFSAVGSGNDIHSFVNDSNTSNNNIASDNRKTVSSVITNSTFVGIGYALGKFEKNVDKVGDLRNFRIQNYQPVNKYEFMTSSSGITNGKVYFEGTKNSTNKLKYLKGTTRYLGYAASTYGLLVSGIDYYDGRIPGSVFLIDIGMTGTSYLGGYGAGISAFYFMGVRNTPDYFNHQSVDFDELRRVQIDNTKVKY